MFKKFKKGFTVVELVVVIAVIALLAAVIIPIFVNVTKDAKLNADSSLVKNLNTSLALDEATNGQAQTMQAALDAVQEYGYSVDKLTPTSNGDIVWDQTTNRFSLVSEGAVVFGDSVTLGVNLWKLTDSQTEAENGAYSYYLKEGFAATSLNVSSGIDVGTNQNIDIIYKGTDAQTVLFRTNGGELSVNNEKAVVNHYGESANVTITAVASDSYHEYGTVSMLAIEYGRVVVEMAGYVKIIDTTKASNIAIEAASDTCIDNIIVDDRTNVDIASTIEKKTLTKTNVANETELTNAINGKAKYISLTGDFQISSPILLDYSMILDGNEHSVKSVATGADQRGIRITTGNVDVTVLNLSITVGNATSDSSYPRGIQVDPDCIGVKLSIDHCNIEATYYGINICNGVNVDLTMTNTTVTAWGALNLWSATYSVKVSNCVLNGVNDKPKGNSNGFGTVVLEGDTTQKTTLHASVIDVQIIDTIITATSTTGNTQTLFLFNFGSVGNVVSADRCTFTLNDEEYTSMYTDDGEANSLIIDGQLINTPKVKNCWYSNGAFSADRNAVNAIVTHFSTIFEQGWLADGEGIILEQDIELEGNLKYYSDGTIYLYFNGYMIAGGKIELSSGVNVISDTSGMSDVFIGGTITETNNGNGTYTYTCS